MEAEGEAKEENVPHAKRFSNEEIIEAYKATGSVWKTAKRLGCVGQSVWERLRILNYPLPNRRWSAEELQELRSLVDHCTLAQIAKQLGRPYAGVAAMASRLKIVTRFGNRMQRKPPRGAGLNKATALQIVRDLERYDGSWRQFCRSRGYSLDNLAKTLQTYAPEFWLRESQARGLNSKICPNCEVEYFPVTAKQATCTRRCAGLLRDDRQYFGGKRRTAVGIREGICQLCLRQKDKGLSAHHVLGKENDPENEVLIALCPGCHQVVGRLAAQKLYDSSDGWERLIELVMARRLADQKQGVSGVYACVDLEYLTEQDCIDTGLLPEPEVIVRDGPYPVERGGPPNESEA